VLEDGAEERIAKVNRAPVLQPRGHRGDVHLDLRRHLGIVRFGQRVDASWQPGDRPLDLLPVIEQVVQIGHIAAHHAVAHHRHAGHPGRGLLTAGHPAAGTGTRRRLVMLLLSEDRGRAQSK
jgi:hypothetical protein